MGFGEVYSGMKYLNELKSSLAVSYDDNTCPVCGNKMDLISVKYINHKKVNEDSEEDEIEEIITNIRFECKCGFCAPIQHLKNGEEITVPLYSKSIDRLLENFKKCNTRRIPKLNRIQIRRK